MLELGSSGSVRGVSGNGHPYRDPGPIPENWRWASACSTKLRSTPLLGVLSSVRSLRAEGSPVLVARHRALEMRRALAFASEAPLHPV
jgi:hypothetical protein